MSTSTIEIMHNDVIAYDSDDSVPTYQQHPDPHHPDLEGTGRLPVYAEVDTGPHVTLLDVADILSNNNRAKDQDINLWQTFIDCNPGWTTVQSIGTVVEDGFFSAIDEGQEDVIALMIENDLVTANTILSSTYETPLLRAVAVKSVTIVRQLLELGAEKDGYGVKVIGEYRAKETLECILKNETIPYYGTEVFHRTPLQLAASLGNLVMVKLLMEQYQCDDSLIAPDGQIAIRLAAENGHREVVDYLPARRGGGLRRWKHKNKASIRSIQKAIGKIAKFLKFFLWDLEKLFLWDLPKHTIVKPLSKLGKYCFENFNGLGPWCKRQILAVPARIKSVGKWIQKKTVKVAKGIWELLTKILPKMIKGILVWFWKLLTVKLPAAVMLLAKWIKNSSIAAAKYIGAAIMSVVSLVSTMVEAVISFFSRVTLADVWNGFCGVLRAVFVAFPKLIGLWIVEFGKGSYKMMKLLFGWVGQAFWYLGLAIGWVITYLPRQFWKILQSVGGVFARAGYEVRVWFDPKAI